MPLSCCPRFSVCRIRPVLRLLVIIMMVMATGCGSRDSKSGGPVTDSPYKKIRRSDARQAAVRMQSQNYLKQIGLAMHTFHETYGQLPIGESDRATPVKYRDGKPLLSWRVHLLPFLEEDPLWSQFKLDEPWDSPHNIKLLDHMPDLYKSLDYQGLGNKTVVLGLSGPGGIFDPGEPGAAPRAVRFRDITDGTSQVVLVVMARPERAVPWTRPDDFVFDPKNPRQGLTTGSDAFLALFADGSAQRIGPQTSPETLLKLFQFRDGAPIDFNELR
ncbi:MAG: DUF1559 domain-containing protein [Pirellulaceae bacterium]